MKKIFLLTGHANFGKSKTLIELTGTTNSQHFSINGIDFALKRVSNDDIKGKALKYIKDVIKNNRYDRMIVAFCPDFKNKNRYSQEIIDTLLQNNFSLYFFVLMKCYRSDETVKEDEIDQLKKAGNVYLCNLDSENAKKRAAKFKEYIIENM